METAGSMRWLDLEGVARNRQKTLRDLPDGQEAKGWSLQDRGQSQRFRLGAPLPTAWGLC
jgi:hypothetical protein